MGNRVLVATLAVLSVAALAAARIHAASGNAPAAKKSGLALTIYNQNFAVVRQPIDLTLEAGSTRVQYADTTAHLEPDSVILQDPSGTHALQILEQNYRNDPVTEAWLLAAYEGKELEFEVIRDGKPQIIKQRSYAVDTCPITTRFSATDRNINISRWRSPIMTRARARRLLRSTVKSGSVCPVGRFSQA